MLVVTPVVPRGIQVMLKAQRSSRRWVDRLTEQRGTALRDFAQQMIRAALHSNSNLHRASRGANPSRLIMPFSLTGWMMQTE